MGEWGDEEKLFVWAREGESLLDDGVARRPKPVGNWVDVLAKAENV